MRKTWLVIGFGIAAGALHAQSVSLLGVTAPNQAAPIFAMPARPVTEDELGRLVDALRMALSTARAAVGQDGAVLAGARLERWRAAQERARAASAALAAALSSLTAAEGQRAAFAARMGAAYRRLAETYSGLMEVEHLMLVPLRQRALQIAVQTGNAGVLGDVKDLVSGRVTEALYRAAGPASPFARPLEPNLAIGLLPPPLVAAMVRSAGTRGPDVDLDDASAPRAGARPSMTPQYDALLRMLEEGRALVPESGALARSSEAYQKFHALAVAFTARYDAYARDVRLTLAAKQEYANDAFRKEMAEAWAALPMLLPGGSADAQAQQVPFLLKSAAALRASTSADASEPLLPEPDPAAWPARPAGPPEARVAALLCPELRAPFELALAQARERGAVGPR